MTSETSAEFLAERRDFLYVYAVLSESDDGWDVVMRLDGTYASEESALEAARELRERIEQLADHPRDHHIWWNGPPEGFRPIG